MYLLVVRTSCWHCSMCVPPSHVPFLLFSGLIMSQVSGPYFLWRTSEITTFPVAGISFRLTRSLSRTVTAFLQKFSFCPMIPRRRRSAFPATSVCVCDSHQMHFSQNCACSPMSTSLYFCEFFLLNKWLFSLTYLSRDFTWPRTGIQVICVCRSVSLNTHVLFPLGLMYLCIGFLNLLSCCTESRSVLVCSHDAAVSLAVPLGKSNYHFQFILSLLLLSGHLVKFMILIMYVCMALVCWPAVRAGLYLCLILSLFVSVSSLCTLWFARSASDMFLPFVMYFMMVSDDVLLADF